MSQAISDEMINLTDPTAAVQAVDDVAQKEQEPVETAAVPEEPVPILTRDDAAQKEQEPVETAPVPEEPAPILTEKTSDIISDAPIKTDTEKQMERIETEAKVKRSEFFPVQTGTMFSGSTAIRNDVERIQTINPVQPESVLFNEVFSTGDAQEDANLIELIDGAYGFYTPYDTDGSLLPGSIIGGNFNVSNSRFVGFSPSNQNRVQTLVKRGSVVLALKTPETDTSTKVISQPVVKQDGTVEYVSVRQVALPQFQQNLDLTGRYIDDRGRIVYEEPEVLGRLMNLVTTSEEDKGLIRERYANLLVANGIDNPYMINRLLKLHDNRVIKSIEFNETVNDLGRFFTNIAIGIANIGLEGVETKLEQNQMLAESIGLAADSIEQAMTDPESMAFMSIGANTILRARILDNPEEQDKVIVGEDGVKRIKLEYLPYAEDMLADSFGITTDQARTVLGFNDDAVEYLTELAPEAVAFAAGEAVYMGARGAYLFNSSFKPMFMKKFPQAKTYEEAVDMANKQGVIVGAVLNEWAEANTRQWLQKFKIRNMLINRKMDLVNVGASLTRVVVGGQTSKAALDAAEKFTKLEDEATQLFSEAAGVDSIVKREKLRALGYAKQVAARKALYVDQYVPRVVSELAGDEFWAAGGSALMGHTLSSSFSEDFRPVGDFFGAFFGLTLLRSGVKGTAKLGVSIPVNAIPGGQAAFRSMLRGFYQAKNRILDSGIDVDREVPASLTFGQWLGGESEYNEIYRELWSSMPPEQQALVEEKIRLFGDLEERLMQVTLPDGQPAFREGEIPTLLADITGLAVLKEVTDYFNARVMASDIMTRLGTAITSQDVIYQRQLLNRRIGETLARMSQVEELKTSPEFQGIIESFGKIQTSTETQIAKDFDEFEQVRQELEANVNTLLTSGTVIRASDGKEITTLNAREILDAKHREVLSRYTGEDGFLTDIESYLEETERLARATRDAFAEKGRLHADVGAAKTTETRSIDTVREFSDRKEADGIIRDSLYEAVRTEHPDARMDGTTLYASLGKEDTVFNRLDDDFGDIVTETDLELSETDKVSMLLSAGATPQKRVRKQFFNAAAMDEFRNNPVIVQAVQITPDMSDKEVLQSLVTFRNTLKDEIGFTEAMSDAALEGNTPTDVWDFFKEVGSKGNPEDLAELGFTRQFSDNLTMPISPRSFHNITKFLGRSADPTTELGKALITKRRELLRDAGDPVKGFQENYYGERTPLIEVSERLKTANRFNTEYQMRYNTPEVSTYGIETLSTQTAVKPAEVVDNIINAALTKVEGSSNPQMVASQTIGSDFARIFGSSLEMGPDGREGFFLVAGEEAAARTADLLKSVSDAKLWLSKPGQEILRLGKSGQALGYRINQGQLEQLSNLMGGGSTAYKPIEKMTDTEILNLVDMFSRVPTYPRRADGSIDFDNPQQLISQERLYEVIDITNFYEMAPTTTGAARRKLSRESTDFVSDYSVGVKRVGADLKAKLTEVRRMGEAERNLRSNAYDNIKRVVAGLEGVTDRPGAVISSTIRTPNGFRLILDAREAHVARAVAGELGENISAEKAREVFNREIFSVMAYEMSSRVKDKRGGLDPTKLSELVNDKELMAAIEEFNPESTQIIRDLQELATGVLDRDTGKVNIRGFTTPYNFDTELNKIWAVSTGRGSLRWWTIQLTARQGRLANQQMFRSMLEDPKLGRDLIDIVKSGKKPGEAKIVRIADTMLTYAALDIYRHNDEENSGGLFVPLVESGIATASAFGRGLKGFFGETTRRDPRIENITLPTSYTQINQEMKTLKGQ